MKDIPVFTTENGAASLILCEIPIRGIAYVRLQAALEPEKLLQDCIGFCRMVGATRIYATGNPILEAYPRHATLVEMACLKDSLEDTDAALWPVQHETLGQFRKLYNEKIVNVPNGAWMSEQEVRRILQDGEGYYIHRSEKLLGIGIVSGSEIRFLGSLCDGAGGDIVRALSHCISDDRVTLQVALENAKAVALYERLGFLKTREISCWYCVFGELTG